MGKVACCIRGSGHVSGKRFARGWTSRKKGGYEVQYNGGLVMEIEVGVEVDA